MDSQRRAAPAKETAQHSARRSTRHLTTATTPRHRIRDPRAVYALAIARVYGVPFVIGVAFAGFFVLLAVNGCAK